MEHRITALESTATRHERVIEEMRGRLDEIHAGLVRIETVITTRAVPGESAFCRQHMTVIDELKSDIAAVKKELDQVKSYQLKLAGVFAAIIFAMTMFGPSIREWLHFSGNRPHSAMIGGTP